MRFENTFVQDLSISSTVSVRVNQRLVTANNFQSNDFSLYKLNSVTGYWEKTSDLVNYEQNTLEAKIAWIDYGTNNFMISKRVALFCSLKVRIYKQGLIMESKQHDVSVRVVSIGPTSWTGSQGYFDQNLYCMSLPCGFDKSCLLLYEAIE